MCRKPGSRQNSANEPHHESPRAGAASRAAAPGCSGCAPSAEIDASTKRYPGGATAVGDFSLQVPAHHTTGFVGSSGCGQTTLLRMVNRMVEPSAGSIRLDGRDISAATPVQLRRSLGYVMQNGGLLPQFTVAENIATV